MQQLSQLSLVSRVCRAELLLEVEKLLPQRLAPTLRILAPLLSGLASLVCRLALLLGLTETHKAVLQHFHELGLGVVIVGALGAVGWRHGCLACELGLLACLQVLDFYGTLCICSFYFSRLHPLNPPRERHAACAVGRGHSWAWPLLRGPAKPVLDDVMEWNCGPVRRCCVYVSEDPYYYYYTLSSYPASYHPPRRIDAWYSLLSWFCRSPRFSAAGGAGSPSMARKMAASRSLAVA